jgi:hypothetical protein
LNNAYKILPEYQLVIEKYTGYLFIEDYIAFKKSIVNDPLFKPNYKFYIDFNQVNFKITEKDIAIYLKFIDHNLPNLGSRFSAIVTNTPNQVVSTTMYKMLQKNRSQVVEIFSTKENAINWLGLEIETINYIDFLNAI